MLGTDREPGRDRPDAAPARDVGRALHLDRLLRARGPGRHLARPDAAQGARAVPHRRVLGRARLPARRHAAGHRRHRAVSLSQYLPRGEVYVVTTPQPAAQKVARLSAAMAEKVNLPVKGIIENMTWFTGDDGKRYELFGSAAGPELADELGVPLLGAAAARAARCAKAATTAGRSWRSTPTARPPPRSAASPSGSPSSCDRRRCSTRS